MSSQLTGKEAEADLESREETALDDGCPRNIQPYDFRRPTKFSKDNIRTIQILHESFCRHFGNLLGGILRINATCTMDSVDQMTYEEFLHSVPSPTLLCVAGLEPQSKPVVIDMDLSLVFGILDRLLGGPGAGDVPAREITEIEQSIMQDIVRQLLAQLSNAWAAVIQDIGFTLEKMESRPQFAQVIAPTDTVLVVCIPSRIGSYEGRINICFPYTTLEEVLQSISTEHWFLLMTNSSKEDSEETLKGEIALTHVPVVTELGRVRLKLSDIKALRAGQVIRIDTRIQDPVVVKVGRNAAFLGRPGTVGNRLAVQVEECLADDLARMIEQ
jgi:flagellar motor switch protein FliM